MEEYVPTIIPTDTNIAKYFISPEQKTTKGSEAINVVKEVYRLRVKVLLTLIMIKLSISFIENIFSLILSNITTESLIE